MINAIGGGHELFLDDMNQKRHVEKGGSFARILENHLTDGNTDKKLMDVCYDMEALFIGIMLKAMRNTVPESDFFGNSIANDIFRDMLYDEYASIMAKSDQFGIARQIYDQLRVRKTV